MATIPGGIFDQGGLDPAALAAIDALLSQQGLSETDFAPTEGGFEPVSTPYVFLVGDGDGAIIGGSEDNIFIANGGDNFLASGAGDDWHGDGCN